MSKLPDDIFANKLKHFQKTPSASAWDRIESNLSSNAGQKKRRFTFLQAAAVIAIVLTSSLVTIKLMQPSGEEISASSDSKEIVKKTIPIDPVVSDSLTQPKLSENASTVSTENKISVTDKKLRKTLLLAENNNKVKTEYQEPPVEKEEQVVLNSDVDPSSINTSIDTSSTVTPAILSVTAPEQENIVLVFSEEEVNEKYLHKDLKEEATTNEKKPSTLRKLLNKASDLKHNNDPIGDLRQKKNEILALNFINKKAETQNR